MKRDVTVIHAGQPWPAHWSVSIYLCGPTPRDPLTPSWRPHAESLLRERWGGDGRLAVFLPEASEGESESPYAQQVAWEEAAMHAADAILFHVPRDLTSLPGLVSNVKWGAWHDCGRVVLCSPPTAQRNEYLLHFANALAVPVTDNLPDAVTEALRLAGPSTRREGVERQIPLALWLSPEFQRWFNALVVHGDTLLAGRLLWSRGNPVTHWVLEATLRSIDSGVERVEVVSRGTGLDRPLAPSRESDGLGV